MHAAPPVRIRVVTDTLWRGFVVACASVAAANLMAWALSWTSASVWLGGLALLISACAAAALTQRQPGHSLDLVGALIWDSACWQWACAANPPRTGTVQVMIDLGPWLLLRFRPSVEPAAGAWLAISRRSAAGQWPAWRAALYAPIPEQASSVITGSA